ncbi:GNAT family N-acetyltransferase [Shewanella dokdonensis]|uniref:GNAT family N-acetyltransferase n=1 Tax=Shewanella dokdonensis TaxID=712036 RepID=A0ABX8DFA2_9GAMM|nr:GNAT family protein [Shewanella dokdonensis]MCL1074961.1 GNAT family N-acetyltransferase [Shewanella dokdonensis]QVK23394.1 GNAT family N-acetyltransferase [Shewanella dokdonensis]
MSSAIALNERVSLRFMVESDWPAFLRLNQDQQLNQYIREVDTEAVLWERFKQRSKGLSAGCGEWISLVVESTSGDFLGLMGICLIEETLQQWEVGYLMAQGQQGKGYATAALQLMLQWAIGQLDVHKFVARCVAANLASAKVLQKCGFRQEGLLRHNHRIFGEWLDECHFGLLAEDCVVTAQS